MKIAVIGSNGQLGSDIVRILEKNNIEVIKLNHQNIEIADIESVRLALNRNVDLQMVINTAAMHNVPNCEKDPQKAFDVNAMGVWNLARVIEENNLTLIHISTDYVFSGHKNIPYLESDLPNPLNVYGVSKLSGEYFVRQTSKRHFILRVSGIYGESPCRAKGSNFVELMLKLSQEREEVRVVDDEVLTPTYTLEIANQIYYMIKKGADYGTYHLSAEGSCSWYEFTKKIFEITKSKTRLSIANPNEFASSIKRPKYSVLKNQMLIQQKMNRFCHWSEGLKDYLSKII
jgi:dTDP-4-dehydrorhamnose reductase